jgi:purine nucleosidase
MRGAVAALALLSITAAAQPQPVPLLLDTDIGDAIDDVFALAFALRSPELDVRAVTTVIDDTERKTRLAWKLLGLYNRRDIPLARGAPEPLLAPRAPSTSRQYEVLTDDDVLPEAAQRPAAGLIVETVHKSPGISIAAIGPLTNLALALKLDPSIKSGIARIYLMGGAYQSQEAEYNIRRDPQAARIVFESGVPVMAVGLEATRPLVLREADLARVRLASDPAGLMLLRLLELNGGERPTLFDPLALAVIVKPDLVQFREGFVTVRDDGRTELSPTGSARAVVGLQVNAADALDLIVSRVTGGRGGPLR